MARKVTLNTTFLGTLNLWVLTSAEIETFGYAPYRKHFTRVSQETIDWALAGWVTPLVKSLNKPPAMVLPLLPKICSRHKTCITKTNNCTPTQPMCPPCFEIDNLGFENSHELLKALQEDCFILEVV